LTERIFIFGELWCSSTELRQFGDGNIMGLRLKFVVTILLLSAAAGCAPKPVIEPPTVFAPPPPPPPPRPLPPAGAATMMMIPVVGPDGVRQTPNRGISQDEAIWHLRSAINVAALNCQGPTWNVIADNYNSYIKLHKKRLTTASRTVDKEYKVRYPNENGLRVRDTKMTDLYNYFSLPTVKQEYCEAALFKSQELLTIPSNTLPEYSFGALREIDGIFVRFFDAYAMYESALAEWNQKYGPPPPPPPVYVAQPVIAPVSSPPIGQVQPAVGTPARASPGGR
jgi:hypothetical protein